MPFKYDEQGNIVTQEATIQGKAVKLPVFIHADGKEVPFDGDGTVQRISGLNAEAKGHREAKEAAIEKLKLFEGIEDPAAAKKALQLTKDWDDKKLVDAGKVEEVRRAATQAMQERLDAAVQAHQEAVRSLQGDKEKLTGQLHEAIVGGAFARSKFINEKMAIPADLVQARFGRHFRVEDGKLTALDSNGKPIGSRLRPGDLNPDFDEALEIIVDSYPNKDVILKGTNASGSGTSNNNAPRDNGGGRKILRAEYDALPPLEKHRIAMDAVAGKTTIVDNPAQ